MKIRNINENNKGLTLVELLVAVCIFAAAIVPMLYAFVYSTGFNFKSQRTLQSTGIAEAIIEKSKGAGVNGQTIMDKLDDGTILDGTEFDITSAGLEADGYYWLRGVKPTNAVDGNNRRTYCTTKRN